MATNILMDLIKTGFNSKQTDFNVKYSSKETSGSFMKVFESANKNYNFNNRKMENFSSKNYNEPQNKQNSDYNYGGTSGNLYNENFLKPKNNNSYEKKYLSSEKTSANINKSAVKQKNIQPTNHSTEDKVKTQKNDDHKTGSKEISQKSAKTADENEKPITKQTSETAENNKTKNQEIEKQDQKSVKSVKDTSEKVLPEKTIPENTAKAVDQKPVSEAAPKAEDKKDVKILQDNSEKKTGKNTANLETKETKKPQQAVQKPEHEKQKTDENKKTEISKNINIKDIKEKQELPEISGKKTDKSEKNQQKQDIKTGLAPQAKDTKEIHAKDNLKIENIKVIQNAEPQKTAKDLTNMNKKGQQDFRQKSLTNANHAGATENGSQKVDLQKTAQFDKILSSKQADSTEKSVLNQVKNASARLSANKSQISITLKPENLGKLNISLVSQKGEVTAQITAESAHVKNMLAKGTGALRQHLLSQGINVNKITINVQQNSSSQNGTVFDQTGQGNNFSGTSHESNSHGELGQNGLNRQGMESYDFEEEENEETDKTMMRNLVGNVDYKV